MKKQLLFGSDLMQSVVKLKNKWRQESMKYNQYKVIRRPKGLINYALEYIK